MCYQAQKHLSQGYCSMLMKSGDFQYSYRLWIEDTEGIEVPLEQNIAQQSTPLSSAYFKDLTKRTSRGVKCYELYSLYLGMVSVNIVANHERTLINLLSPNKRADKG